MSRGEKQDLSPVLSAKWADPAGNKGIAVSGAFAESVLLLGLMQDGPDGQWKTSMQCLRILAQVPLIVQQNLRYQLVLLYWSCFSVSRNTFWFAFS